MNQSSNYDCYVSRQNIEVQILKFTLELYDQKMLPRGGVDVVITCVKNLISDVIVPHLQLLVKNTLSSKENEPACSRVLHVLENNKNFFDLFDTEHKRIKYYQEKCSYIPPSLYELGNSKNFKTEDPFSSKKVEGKPVYGATISMIDTLTTVFTKTDLFNHMYKYALELTQESKSKSNYIQFASGSKKYTFNSSEELRFPLNGYSDAFESRGPLSSHAGQQKLTGVYYSLPLLPPHLVSKVDNVFLSCLFHSKYLNEEGIGYEAAFKPFIDDAKILSEKGILVPVNGKI